MKSFFLKTEIRAYCIVWCNNFIYLPKFYDVHLWALNLSGKGLLFKEKSLTSLYCEVQNSIKLFYFFF